MNTSLQRALVAGALLSTAALAPKAQAQSLTNIVISEVYGGGGNSGSVYTNDFIELYNNGTTAFTFANYSLQYASATSTTAFTTTAPTSGTPLFTIISGTIPAKGYFLVQEGPGAGGTTALPTPDATGTIAISSSKAQIALVNSTTALTTADFTGSTPTGASIVDFVGFGVNTAAVGATSNGAARYEGAGPAPTLSNTTSTSRIFVTATSTYTDTNNNNLDFATPVSPTPTGSGLAAAPEPSGTASLLVGAALMGGLLCVARRRSAAQSQAA